MNDVAINGLRCMYIVICRIPLLADALLRGFSINQSKVLADVPSILGGQAGGVLALPRATVVAQRPIPNACSAPASLPENFRVADKKTFCQSNF